MTGREATIKEKKKKEHKQQTKTWEKFALVDNQSQFAFICIRFEINACTNLNLNLNCIIDKINKVMIRLLLFVEFLPLLLFFATFGRIEVSRNYFYDDRLAF